MTTLNLDEIRAAIEKDGIWYGKTRDGTKVYVDTILDTKYMVSNENAIWGCFYICENKISTGWRLSGSNGFIRAYLGNMSEDPYDIIGPWEKPIEISLDIYPGCILLSRLPSYNPINVPRICTRKIRWDGKRIVDVTEE